VSSRRTSLTSIHWSFFTFPPRSIRLCLGPPSSSMLPVSNHALAHTHTLPHTPSLPLPAGSILIGLIDALLLPNGRVNPLLHITFPPIYVAFEPHFLIALCLPTSFHRFMKLSLSRSLSPSHASIISPSPSHASIISPSPSHASNLKPSTAHSPPLTHQTFFPQLPAAARPLTKHLCVIGAHTPSPPPPLASRCVAPIGCSITIGCCTTAALLLTALPQASAAV